MFRILPPHERAVVYTVGRISGVKGPGLVLLVPLVQTMRRVDMREATAQARNATVTYRVVDPAKALEAVSDYATAVEKLLGMVLDSTLAGRPADALVFEREAIAEALRGALEPACTSWGLAITKVAVNR